MNKPADSPFSSAIGKAAWHSHPAPSQSHTTTMLILNLTTGPVWLSW